MEDYEKQFSATQKADIAQVNTVPQLEIEEKIIFVLDESNIFNLHPESKDMFESLLQNLNIPSLKILKSIQKISQSLKYYLEKSNLSKIEDFKPDAKAKGYLIFSVGLMGLFFLFLIIDSYWLDDNVLSYIGIFFITASLAIQAIIIFMNGRCKRKSDANELDYNTLETRIEKTKEILKERNRKMMKLKLMLKVDEDNGDIELIQIET